MDASGLIVGLGEIVFLSTSKINVPREKEEERYTDPRASLGTGEDLGKEGVARKEKVDPTEVCLCVIACVNAWVCACDACVSCVRGVCGVREPCCCCGCVEEGEEDDWGGREEGTTGLLWWFLIVFLK